MERMINKNTVISIIACCVVINGCTKLDLSRLDTQSVGTYYKTASDANAATIAMYGQLRSMYRDEVFVTPNSVATDEGVPFLTGNADRVALWNYNIISTNSFTGSIWGASYTGIQRSNIVLAHIPGITMDETLKKQYLGEALFLRALHYFNLVRFYGGVPIVENEVTDLTNINVARGTVDDVYELIISDLTTAAGYLPVSYTGEDVGRATKGASLGLLSKVFLTRAGTDQSSEYWQQAATYAKQVMDMGVYGLWDDYAAVYALANRGGKESLFEAEYITDLDGNNFTTGYAPRGAPIVPGTGSGIFRVTSGLFNLFQDADKRKAVTFLTSYVNPTSGATVQLSTDNTDPAYAVSFWKLADLTSTVGGMGGTSFPILRYSDILLIYAEALNEVNNGPSTEALQAVNQVRERAGLSDLATMSKQAFKDSVLLERRKEFCFEANRWFDLVRTGTLVDAVQQENSFSRNAAIQDFNKLFPIPQTEMDINPALVQNDGY
ncbi:RagB/SusD family nutrient uptake outer membrane protein [Parafilimonas sp.]|uniref:RagB/SusD family nutrient uptake outer membrane protein n=1 Tax=Parafilimonas sp. TaxID=1969739 RepID=UPI0039E3E618